LEPSRIRIAQPAPPYCSGCFQAKPLERHVDFGSCWDGPAMPGPSNTVGVIAQAIDDLILCEQCLTEAAKLIGLGDVEKVKEELEGARAVNDALHEELAAQKQYAANLESAFQSRPAKRAKAAA
jgi:hypothetical protein